MNSSWYLILGLTLALTMTGCSSGGGSSSDDNDDPNSTARSGLYLGTITQGSKTADSTLLLSVGSDGSGRLIEKAPGTYAKGTIQFSGAGSFEGSIDEFLNGERAASGTLTGDSTTNSFSGKSFDTNGEQFNSFTFDRISPLSDRPTNIATVEGSWSAGDTVITIASDGSFNGGSSECGVNGQLSVPDGSINLYELSYNVDTCALAGEYGGFAYYAPENDGNPEQLVFLGDDGERNIYEVFSRP